MGVLTGHRATLLAQRAQRFAVPTSSRPRHGEGDVLVRRVPPSALALVVAGQELCFDKLIQPREVDIGQDGAAHAALRCPAQRRIPAPVLQIPRRQHVAQQPQEAIILDAFSQDRQERLMVEPLKALGNIALKKPLGSLPAMTDSAQCLMTATVEATAMIKDAKLDLKVRTMQQAHHIRDLNFRTARYA